MRGGGDRPAIVVGDPVEEMVGGDPVEERLLDVGRGVALCCRVSGDPLHPAIVLIAGLGQQLNVWPGELVRALESGGHLVVRFDNRDVGRSSRSPVPAPGRGRLLTGRFSPAQYTLADMADDTVGLLDALGIAAAHLVGMSMGGMIAQTVAATHPSRVLTLTSIMSTTGSRRAGRPALSTYARLAAPMPRTRAAAAARVVSIMRHVGSRGYPFDEAEASRVALEAFDRGGGAGTAGVTRQIAAIHRSGDRTAELARIVAPTLVIHGDRDLMVHPSGGRATAAAIPGAELLTLPGLGHDLPAGVVAQLAAAITRRARRADPPTDPEGAPRLAPAA